MGSRGCPRRSMKTSTEISELQACECGSLFRTKYLGAKKCSMCRTRERMIRATTSYQCLHDPSGYGMFKHGYISMLQMREMLKFAYLQTGSVWKKNRVVYIVRGEQNASDGKPSVPQWLDTEDAELYLSAVAQNGQKSKGNRAASA